MILKWKGRCDHFDTLPKGNLPPDAVMFKEPKTALELNKRASLYVIPVLCVVILAVVTKAAIHGLDGGGSPSGSGIGELVNAFGFLLAVLMVIPHEFLHAVAFPKKAEVGIWYSPKYMLAFVHSTAPVGKWRFVFMSLLPNLVLGLIPLMAWVILPVEVIGEQFSGLIFSFSFMCLLFGIGDYMNVHNAIVQMPKGALTQLSGFNSYWFMPSKEVHE